jgi:hypothetical protein
LVILTVYGAPFNPFEFVSLLGSLCLLVAAYVSLFRPYAAARLALLASLAIWCFYGPAIAKSIRTKLGKQSSEFRAPAVFTSPRCRRSLATTTVSVVRAGRFIASSGLGED